MTLATKNRRKISAVVRDIRCAIFDLDDAMQAFLIGANRALDAARTQDDGRGHNDPEAYCAWRGMLAVRESMRNVRGRQGRPCIKQHAEARVIHTGALANTFEGNEAGSLFYADPNDYAGEACVNIGLPAFLSGLRGFDRDLASLLVYGETKTIMLTCTCTGAVHSYIHDLACALNCSEHRIFRGIRRLRDAGKREFELA